MTQTGATSSNPNNIISQSQMEQLKNAMAELKYSNKMSAFKYFQIFFFVSY